MWGGGWLQSMGFHDFAGSAAVHNIGGVIAMLGAALLGPRIGKYDKDGKPHAIPSHIGDGKIFVYNVTRVVKIRTGEEDFAALQDVE